MNLQEANPNWDGYAVLFPNNGNPQLVRLNPECTRFNTFWLFTLEQAPETVRTFTLEEIEFLESGTHPEWKYSLPGGNWENQQIVCLTTP